MNDLAVIENNQIDGSKLITFHVDFKCTYLHNKFGTITSVKVPNTIIKPEEFTAIYNVLRSDGTRKKFKLFGNIPEITGECLLPGEGNYALINNKYYHLEKTEYAGPFKDENETTEGYYYSIIYDDGMNDWMQNKIYLVGTINKTGNKQLVLDNQELIVYFLENETMH